MPRSILTQLMTVVLAGLLAAEESQAADPAAGKAAAKKLLEMGSEKGPAAKAAVDRQYAEAEKISPSDPYLRYAHWVVLMDQGRYDDSRDNLEGFLKDYKTNLQAWRALTWNQTILGEYPLAIDSAKSLGQLVAADPAKNNGDVSADHQEAIIFLGRLAGFLEGPLEKVVIQANRKKLETQLVAKFDEPRKKLYEKARDEVLDKYTALMNDASGAGQAAKQSAEADKQKALDKLGKENQELEKAAKKVEEREKQLADEAKKTLENLNQRDAALAQQLMLLQQQAAPLNNQFNQQQADAQRQQQQAANEQNPQLRQSKQAEAQRAANLADGTKRQLDNLNNQILMANANRNAIQELKLRSQGGAAIQTQELDNALRGIDRGKQRLEGKQKRKEQAKAPSSSTTRSLENQARAFRTYDPFTIEELKAFLLARLQ